MRLSKYNLTISLSDPDDSETEITARLEQVPREELMSHGALFSSLVEVFEQSVVIDAKGERNLAPDLVEDSDATGFKN